MQQCKIDFNWFWASLISSTFCVANTKNAASNIKLKLSVIKVYKNKCLRNCSNKGTCIKGKCQCNTGFTFRDCSKKATLFTLDKEPSELSVAPGQYSYTMIPITQVYENTGFVFGNYTDPLELYISGVTLNTNGKNQTKPTSSARMLERAL